MIFLNKRQNRLNKQGFYTLEYVILIFVVLAALTFMFLYLKFSLCGRARETIDTFGDGRLYYPYKTVINVTTP